MGETDVVNAWSLRIAKEATPNEVEVAPAIARAFVAGGREKKELLQSAGVQGGTGGEIILSFPVILSAIEAAGPHLLHFLSTVADHSEVVSSFAAALSSLVNVRSYLDRRKQAKSLPDDPYVPLKVVSDVLTEELRKAGFDEDRANSTAYLVLKAMMEDPAGAGQFTKKVT